MGKFEKRIDHARVFAIPVKKKIGNEEVTRYRLVPKAHH